MSALKINQVCEDYIRRRAVRHLERGRIAIFAAGTGNPFFTTDSAASLRAIEIGADMMIKATKVDGVYDGGPCQTPDAVRYEQLSYDEAIVKKLGVMDATALVLCRDQGMPSPGVRFEYTRQPGPGGLRAKMSEHWWSKR